MPLQRSHKIAIIAIVAVLAISATVVRFVPMNNEGLLSSASLQDNPKDVQDLTDSDVAPFLNNSTLFVLDFYYPGCGPCNFVNNITRELSGELGGQVQFGRMNVRDKESGKTIKDYKVSKYPTLLIFGEGVLVNRISGNTSKSELLASLEEIKPSLDTSRVKISESARAPSEAGKQPASDSPEAGAEQNTSEKCIPLIKPGTKNPDQAMLVDDATIDSAISQYQPLLVVVGFTNPCPYCELFNVTISELSSELQGQVAFAMIDTRPNLESREKYNITRIPATLIFNDGKLAGMVQGNKDKATIVAKLKEIDPGLNLSKVSLPLSQLKLTPQEACAKMNKSDQPLLEAFVVSRCPFGLQMQRIMAAVISEAKGAEEHLKVRYIGSVDAENNTIKAMHGDVEAQENLRQICIREEQPAKYWDYVRCYMQEGKAKECLQSASIDVVRLESCTNGSSRGVAYAQEDFEIAEKFKITGSPTLLMNDEIVRESHFATNTTNARSSEALKELLCCGFKEKPEFCFLALNESRAATMFSAARLEA
jgi:thiol-disulfide isomerase/thioredoxin